MPVLPADTPCKLIVGKDAYQVIVVSVSEDEIIVASDEKLPESLGKARLENGSTVLMELMIQFIEHNAAVPNPAGDRILPASEGEEPVPFQRIHPCSGVSFDRNKIGRAHV